jgi:hypothetical protein
LIVAYPEQGGPEDLVVLRPAHQTYRRLVLAQGTKAGISGTAHIDGKAVLRTVKSDAAGRQWHD